MMSATTAPAAMTPYPWWLTIIQGVAAIVIGFLLLTAPAQTTIVLVQLLGIYWLISGVMYLVSIFVDSRQWGWKLFMGVVGVIAGLVVIQHPLWSALLVPATLIVVLGVWGLIIGAFEIYEAFTGAGWGRAVLGALSIFFGLVLLSSPMLAALSLPFVLGVFALVGGIASLVVGFRDRPATGAATGQVPPAQRAA